MRATVTATGMVRQFAGGDPSSMNSSLCDISVEATLFVVGHGDVRSAKATAKGIYIQTGGALLHYARASYTSLTLTVE